MTKGATIRLCVGTGLLLFGSCVSQISSPDTRPFLLITMTSGALAFALFTVRRPDWSRWFTWIGAIISILLMVGGIPRFIAETRWWNAHPHLTAEDFTQKPTKEEMEAMSSKTSSHAPSRSPH